MSPKCFIAIIRHSSKMDTPEIRNKMSVCKTVMPPYCHIDTESGTVHLLISKNQFANIDIISGKNKALNQINSINSIVCY